MKKIILLFLLVSALFSDTTYKDWKQYGFTKEEMHLFKDKLELDSPELASRYTNIGMNAELIKSTKIKTIIKRTKAGHEDRINKAIVTLTKMMCTMTNSVYGRNCYTEMFKEAIKKGISKDMRLCMLKHPNQTQHCLDSLMNGREIPGGYRPTYFDEADPYDNSYGHYLFKGKLLQRIDRTHGLFSSDGETVYIILPKGRFSEGNTYMMIVKGNGNYKYTTVDGYAKNIPKGTIISYEQID